MASYKNFSQKSRAIKEGAYDNFDNALSHDPKKQKRINLKLILFAKRIVCMGYMTQCLV